MIKASAEKHGVPLDVMRHVIGTETGHLSPDKAATAVSNKGAFGVGQLMPAAIKDYNVKDPSDPRQSIDASARIMADHLKKYKGNVPQAFAAYNAGPGVVADYLNGTNKSGKNPNKRTTTDGIPPWTETQNYIKNFVRDDGSNVPDVSTRVADTAKTVATKSVAAATGSKSANAETPLKVQGKKMADATTQQSKDGMYQKHMPGAVVMPDWRGQPDEKAGLGPVILRPNGRWETLDGKRYINDPKFIDKINTTPASSNAGTSLERGDPQSFWDKTKRVLSGELASQVFGDDNPKQRQFQDARAKMWDEQDTIAKQTGGPVSNVKMSPDGSWTGTDAKGKPVGGGGALKTQVAQASSQAPAAKTADTQSSQQTVSLGFGDPGYTPFVGNKVEKRSDGNWYRPGGDMPVPSNVAKHAETQLAQQNKGQNVVTPPADQTAIARSIDTAKSVGDNTAAAATNSANAATQNKAAATPTVKAEPVAPAVAAPVKPVSTPPTATTAEPKPVSWQEIAKLNNITDPTKLKARSYIELPNGQGSYYVTKGDTLSGIAQRLNTTGDPQLNQPGSVNKPAVQPAASSPAAVVNPADSTTPAVSAATSVGSIANDKAATQYGTDQKDTQNRIDARTDQLARIEKNRNELPNTLAGTSDRTGGNGTVPSNNEPSVDRLKTLAGNNNNPISVSADNKPNQTVSQPGDAGLIGNAFQMAQDDNQKRTNDRAAMAVNSPADAKQMKQDYQRSIVNPEFMNDLTDPGPEPVTPAKPVTSTAPVPVAEPQTNASVTANNSGVKSVEPANPIRADLNKLDNIQSSPPAAAAKEPANGNTSDSDVTLPNVIATAEPEKINVWRDSSGKPVINRSGEPWGTGTSTKDDIDAAKIELQRQAAPQTTAVVKANDPVDLGPGYRGYKGPPVDLGPGYRGYKGPPVQLPPPAASNSAVKITTPLAVAPTAATSTAAPAATSTAAPAATSTAAPAATSTAAPAPASSAATTAASGGPFDISPDSKQSIPPPKIPVNSEPAPPVQGESISKGNRWSFISGLI
jgi:hypothetical protein